MIRSTFSIDAKSFEPQSEFLDMAKAMIDPDTGTALKMVINFFVQDILKLFNVT